MRLRSTCFALLNLSICLCYGAPPGEVIPKSICWKRFTEEEDRFIVEELSRILQDPSPTGGLHRKAMWKIIEESHRKKWEEGTQGFPQERTAASLRSRFKDVLVFNRPEGKVKVPESWINAGRGGSGKPYNKDEDKFIIEEVLKRYNAHDFVFSASTLDAIHKEHDKNRLDKKIPGFESRRSAYSINTRIKILRNRGLLPREISIKGRKGSNSGESSHRRQQTDLQESREELDDADLADMIEELLNNTDYEIDFSVISPSVED